MSLKNLAAGALQDEANELSNLFNLINDGELQPLKIVITVRDPMDGDLKEFLIKCDVYSKLGILEFLQRECENKMYSLHQLNAAK